MALTSVSTVKTYLGITGSSEDTRLDALRGVAERLIKIECQRDFEVGTYGAGASAVAAGVGDSGYYNGDNSKYIVLRQRPVTTLTSVYLDPTGRFGDNPDGAFASSTLEVAGTDYVLKWDGTLPGSTTRCSYSGIIEKVSGVWPGLWKYSHGSINPHLQDQQGNIKVTYTAGFSTIPDDIQYAVALVVAQLRRTAIFGGLTLNSEHFEDYSYSLSPGMRSAASSAMQLGEVKAIMSRYREIYI